MVNNIRKQLENEGIEPLLKLDSIKPIAISENYETIFAEFKFGRDRHP